MDNQLISLVEKIVEKKLKEMQPMTREPAEVVSVDGLKAVVRFLNGSEFELLNKSGEVLSEGDAVWVEYRTLPSAGYIAMRNGEPEGLYEEAVELASENLVPMFKTHVKDVVRGAFSKSISSGNYEAKICEIEATDKPFVLHLFPRNLSESSTYDATIASISKIVIKSNGQPVYYEPEVVQVGKEVYVTSTAVWQVGSLYTVELYVVFNTTGGKQFNYDVYRINRIENSYSDPAAAYTVNIDPHKEGAGSSRYRELVRYVCEEIATIKQRLDALGG